MNVYLQCRGPVECFFVQSDMAFPLMVALLVTVIALCALAPVASEFRRGANALFVAVALASFFGTLFIML